ncbi:hypothetical protein [Acaryochloris thomasi]|nr:hypothetical protein [Acaryochloris thomasi]
MLIFSGIVTAFVGAALGVVIDHVSQTKSRRATIILVGSTLGFVIGVGYEAVQQQKEEKQ